MYRDYEFNRERILSKLVRKEEAKEHNAFGVVINYNPYQSLTKLNLD